MDVMNQSEIPFPSAHCKRDFDACLETPRLNDRQLTFRTPDA
jgi:hypothetical protein